MTDYVRLLMKEAWPDGNDLTAKVRVLNEMPNVSPIMKLAVSKDVDTVTTVQRFLRHTGAFRMLRPSHSVHPEHAARGPSRGRGAGSQRAKAPMAQQPLV